MIKLLDYYHSVFDLNLGLIGKFQVLLYCLLPSVFPTLDPLIGAHCMKYEVVVSVFLQSLATCHSNIMERRRRKGKSKESADNLSLSVTVKKTSGITELDFKQLRICLQQILNKINGLMLPLIKNCKNDKVS